ncbi:MAG: phosphoribosylpyrophosphate synthetase [bacterium]
MASYDTITEALAGLEQRGFTHSFSLKQDCIACEEAGIALPPDQFEIVEVHRFEGMTDPDDSAVIYAIQSREGVKGVLVDAYGVYSDSMKAEMISKLRIVRDHESI